MSLTTAAEQPLLSDPLDPLQILATLIAEGRYQLPFELSEDEWKTTAAKVQGILVKMAGEIDRLSDIIRFLIGDKYGRKSEKSRKKDRKESGEPGIVNGETGQEPADAPHRDAAADTSPTAPEEPPLLPPPPPAFGRKKIPGHLPRRDVILDVLEGEQWCACCGEERPSFISDDDTSEQYGFIPAQVFVWRYKRRKYFPCLCGGRARGEQSDKPLNVMPGDTPLPTRPDGVMAAPTLSETEPDWTGAASTEPLMPADITAPLTVPVGPVAPHESGGKWQAGILVAPPRVQMIPKGLPSHGLLVDIIIKKVQDGMPLYRQAAQFLRQGIVLKRSTMSGWLIKVGKLLRPIMTALRLEVLLARCIHIDETPFDVLSELAQKATAKSYMWVFAGGPAGRPAVEFRYDRSRSADVPRQYLQGYRGDVLTDGYVGYDFLSKWEGVVLMGCWVHVRRKFHEVIKALPAKFRGKDTIASQALERIRVLYRLEKYADQQKFTEEQRRVLRLERAKPVIDAMKTWLEKVRPSIPASSKLGEAISYALNQWERLEPYVYDGSRPLDNNYIENLIRSFAVGRKAWLFCATPDGAAALATFHSLVATAIVNKVDPSKYLRALFDQFALQLEHSHPVHGPSPEQCRALLPQYMDPSLLDANVPESAFLLSTEPDVPHLNAAA